MPRRSDVQPKLAFIDGMRGAAALYVVVGHMFWLVEAKNARSEWPEWLTWIASPFWYGQLAVAAFIVLSGFCLQMSLFDRKDGRIHEPLKFLKRRARRILPPYYACLGISVLIALTVTRTQTGMPFSQYLPVDADTVTPHLLLIHNLSPDWMYKINGVLWSIAVEAQLYLVFPLFILLLFSLGRLPFMLLTMGGSVYALNWVPAWTRVWYIGLFALGMLAAHLAYRPEPRLGTRGVWAAVVGVLLFGGCVASRALTKNVVPGDLLIGAAVASWLYAGSVSPWNFAARTFSYKPLAVIGVFSYSLYLMHHPLLQVLYVYRPAGIQGAEGEALYLLSIGLLGILLGAILFFLAFERPFLNKRLKRASVRVSTRAQPASEALRALEPREVVVVESPGPSSDGEGDAERGALPESSVHS